MKTLITGFRGFIGSNLYRELLSKDGKIYGWEKHNDYSDPQLEDIVKDVDVIFHIGAISDTSLQDANEMMWYNYHCSKILFDLAQKHNKQVVYSSSAAVYGKEGVPSNIYGWSKLAAEDYGMATCDKFVSLRYFNVYGPGEEHKGKMSSVAFQGKKLGRFNLFPGNPKRDFVYVKDVVSANLAAVNAEKGIYEVGYGEARTFESLLDGMNVPFGYHSESKIPFWYQNYTCANPDKRIKGWVPQYNVEKGTEDYKQYLENGA